MLLGPPGSGKGTQASLLSEEMNVSVLNVGDLLHYEGGKGVQSVMKKGEIVNEKLTLKLVVKHLKGDEHKSGVILDGFPRTLWQAQNFDYSLDRVVYLKVSDSVNKERLTKRGRLDDIPDTVDKRLQIYHQRTEPILDYYKTSGILLEVNGEQSVDKVFKDITSALE